MTSRGMTLVELLVVVAIMMLLVAVGAPMLRPMLEKQGTSQGAQSLRVMLLRARNMAIEKGIPFAIRLERVQDVNVAGNFTHAAVRLSIVRESPATSTAHDYGVDFDGTDVNFYKRLSTGWETPSTTTNPFSEGTRVQFWGSGEIYTVKGTDFVNELEKSFQDFFPQNYPPIPIFIVKQQPPWLPTSVPPLLMPEGICVDLEFSGIGKSGNGFNTLGDVLVWFLPDGSIGHVDCVNTVSGDASDKCDGLVHFLIGSWEQISQNIGTISEDTSTNLEIPANIWVTLDPRSGRVVINEIKVPSTPGDIAEAREFANQIWNEVAAPR